mmetsp:Transcript_125320/g.217236  ORF Transcript_125320/g.217236 Transcript_125320/m.217236 type:complete len:412 (-) Transcript_125320:2492-3727(-)
MRSSPVCRWFTACCRYGTWGLPRVTSAGIRSRARSTGGRSTASLAPPLAPLASLAPLGGGFFPFASSAGAEAAAARSGGWFQASWTTVGDEPSTNVRSSWSTALHSNVTRRQRASVEQQLGYRNRSVAMLRAAPAACIAMFRLGTSATRSSSGCPSSHTRRRSASRRSSSLSSVSSPSEISSSGSISGSGSASGATVASAPFSSFFPPFFLSLPSAAACCASSSACSRCCCCHSFFFCFWRSSFSWSRIALSRRAFCWSVRRKNSISRGRSSSRPSMTGKSGTGIASRAYRRRSTWCTSTRHRTFEASSSSISASIVCAGKSNRTELVVRAPKGMASSRSTCCARAFCCCSRRLSLISCGLNASSSQLADQSSRLTYFSSRYCTKRQRQWRMGLACRRSFVSASSCRILPR